MRVLFRLSPVAALLLVVVTPILGQKPGSDHLIVIKAARLVDGTGGPVIENAVVVVRGEKIELVGTQVQIRIPEGAEVIDVGDQTLLPGLIDTHGKLTSRPDLSGAEGVFERMDEGLLGRDMTLAVTHSRTALMSGVTTIRVAGEAGYADVYLADAIRKGTLVGPRIVASGLGLTSTGGPGPRSWKKDSPDALRVFIRDNLHRGALTMKLSLEDVSPSASNFTKAELDAIVDELQRRGRVLSAETKGPWGSSLTAALTAGIKLIENPFPLNEDFFPLFKKAGAAISVNELERYIYFDPELWSFYDRKAKDLEAWQQRLKKTIEAIDSRNEPDPDWSDWLKEGFSIIKAKKSRQAQLRQARAAGIPVTVGTGSAYGAMAQQLQYLVEAGWTPKEAIEAATNNASKVLGLERYIGTIEEGKYADIISVKGNPLVDIRRLSAVGLIVKEGQRYDPLSFR